MRVIDSFNGVGLYAVAADSAKSAASAATAKYDTNGSVIANQDYVAYNYVTKDTYNKFTATSSMSGTVENCMQYSTWLPAFYYQKTDTSSKDELSAAFANVTGGGGGGTGDMLVSKLEFNASDEITGYDGSAFAQGGGGSKVDSTARLCIIGNNNTASLSSVSSDATFVQGVENSAYGFSFAQGYKNLVSGTYTQITTQKTAMCNFAQGYTNTAYNYGMAQGKSNLAYNGFAQGTSNTASGYSISIGNLNKAINDSISIGVRNTACYNSLAIGSNNTANSGTYIVPDGSTYTGGGFSLGYSNNTEAFSFGLGQSNYASGFSISLGYNCTAKDYSQSFGLYNVITDYGMVIGKYNKTSANAAFVIGNGDSTANRSDLFVIDKSGNVSALSGYFYDKDGKVGGAGGTVIIRFDITNSANYSASVNGEPLSPTDCVTLVQNNPNVILRTYTSGNDGIEEDANFYPANFYDDGATITFTSQNVTDGTDIGNLNVIASRNGDWERHSYSTNYTQIS